ncbi:unnamed protein product [Chrysoparadoxa australica]
MLLSKYKTIYLHPPKTAGNAIQSALIKYSDDQISSSGHQDGVDRFEIIGENTPRKHAVLADYARTLDTRLAEYKVAVSVRHPFDRALSMYFSPHRWFRKDGETFVAVKPVWNIETFEMVLNDMQSMADFLRLGEHIATPDFIIRFESLDQSFSTFTTQAGIPYSRSVIDM